MDITELQPLIDKIIERLNSHPHALLDLSVRSANCLDSADIQTVLELVSYTEKEMLSIPQFGKKQLNELKHELSKFDFHFGMFKKHEENK